MPTIKNFSTKKSLAEQFEKAGIKVTLPFSCSGELNVEKKFNIDFRDKKNKEIKMKKKVKALK